MSAMLLCRNRRVRTPYFSEDLGIHLYSGEELSYYIYHYAMLIGDDFLEERLFRFIGQELGMEALEAKLRRWVDVAELSELLLVILQDIHYYNSDELNAFQRSMEELGSLSAAMRMKKKAEYLLEQRRYAGAVLQYDRLLNMRSDELKDAVFRSQLWTGKGIAYARQYRFSEAADCFERAERSHSSMETRRMLYQIGLLNPELIPAVDIRNRMTAEEKASWEDQLNHARTQARFFGKGQDAAEWMDKDKIRRAEGLRELTKSWKAEYRRNQDC